MNVRYFLIHDTTKRSRNMSSISKLSSKCEKCSYKDICNNKRIVACASSELPKNLVNDASAQLKNPLGNPLSNMENIKEQLEKQLRINVCSFNKSEGV